MTHTLHRVGSRKSLEKDYVIYGLASNIEMLKGNETLYNNTKELLTKFMEICYKHDPVNAGCIYPATNPYSKTLAKGNTWEDMKGEMIDYTETLVVFDNKEKLKSAIQELKEAELGISIVVSGIFEEVFECCQDVDLTPHTVNIALGIFGKKESLPRKGILELVTMCGHRLVSRYLAEDMVHKIKENHLSVEEAAHRLEVNCVCGAFNTARAVEILGKLVVKR